MATPRKKAPRRDDWAEVETFPLADGRSQAVRWQNLLTNETATLAPGMHPLDNRNAIVALNAPQIDQDDAGGDESLEDDESSADRVAEFLRGSSGLKRADVHISRIKPDGTQAHCVKMPAEEFETMGLDGLRARFGAGKFQVMLYAERPQDNRYVRRALQIFDLEEIRDVNPVAAPSSDIVRLIDRMDQRLNAIEIVKPDPMENMRATLTMMTLMREAMGLTTQPAQPVQQQSPLNAIKEIAAVLAIVKDIRKEIEPPAPDDDDPLTKIVGQFAPMLTAALSKPEQHAQALPMIQANPLPPIIDPLPQTAQETVEQSLPVDEDAEMQTQLAVFYLLSSAKNDADVDDVAEMIYEKAPADLFGVIESEQWWQAMLQLSPKFAPYQAYFERVRNRVIEIAREEEKETPAPNVVPLPSKP
jgi:hypothetical protein